MPYKPIIGTLGYILSPQGDKVLMVRRDARPNDDHFGKYNGLGGKMEMGESVSDCMRREILEEAGIQVISMRLRGTINWTNFGPKGEDWLGFIYLIESFSGLPKESNPEGELVWVELGSLSGLPMWEGDRHFLPLVFDQDPKPFHGYMPYDREKPLAWSFSRE